MILEWDYLRSKPLTDRMLLFVGNAKIRTSHHRPRCGALNYGSGRVATSNRRRWAEKKGARAVTEVRPGCPLGFDVHMRRAGRVLRWRWRRGEMLQRLWRRGEKKALTPHPIGTKTKMEAGGLSLGAEVYDSTIKINGWDIFMETERGRTCQGP